MESLPVTLVLPRLDDIFDDLPNNVVNPNYSIACPASRLWIEQYGTQIYGPKMQAFMNNCNFELSTTYTYPYADAKRLRATMDLVNILWLYDEYTDRASGAHAKEMASIVYQALSGQQVAANSWVGCMMQDFYRQHIEKAGPNTSRRFVDHFCRYAQQVGEEASLREQRQILNMHEYIDFRRETSGVRSCFDLVEYCLGIDLPQFVHDDPIFTMGYNAAMDLVFWVNDLYSYNMEQAKGHGAANVVTVIMKSKSLGLQAAVDHLADACEVLTAQFLEAKSRLSKHPESIFSKEAVKVLDAYGDWVRGNEEWSFVTERYFGKENKAVRQSRMVKIKTPFGEMAPFSGRKNYL
uniref:Terpene synthase n=1 Tax=Clitopilus sp. TaxID=1967123 RepID=A0A4P2VJ78_9AGAR|nr:putative sesquiterpene synthase [Clitopilus sp.]